MTSLRWTEVAAEDLASIKRFIERDSPHYARLVIERLLNQAERIPAFPMAGRTVPELDREDIRELIYGSYRIVYWIDGAEAVNEFETPGELSLLTHVL